MCFIFDEYCNISSPNAVIIKLSLWEYTIEHFIQISQYR